MKYRIVNFFLKKNTGLLRCARNDVLRGQTTQAVSALPVTLRHCKFPVCIKENVVMTLSSCT